MKYLLLILTFIVSISNAQPIKINGRVQSSTGETVSYALVVDSLNRKTVYSDINGNFQLVSNQGKMNLHFIHASFNSVSAHLVLTKDTLLNIILPNLEIDEVLVKGTPLAKQALLGVNFLDGKMIQHIPLFFGEPDLVKAIAILPGITTGIDMYSGVYVRGGNRDQNLFLVDGARYYTTSHAGGLLSLFNPDMVRHVDVYKGVAPAKYGGAVSSVVDISYTEGGNLPHLNIDLGTLRSGVFMETSGGRKFYAAIAGRISHLDFLTGNAFKKIEYTTLPLNDEKEEFNKYNFWDLDGKLVYKPTMRTAFSLNVHLGQDENASYRIGPAYIANVSNVKWNNGRGTYVANNNVTFNIRHLSKTGITFRSTSWFTNYQLSNQNREECFSEGKHYSSFIYNERTFIKDISSKIELTYFAGDKHRLNLGAQLSAYKVNPKSGFKSDDLASIDTIFGEKDAQSIEAGFFIEDQISLTNKTLLKIGCRATALNSVDTSFLFVEPRTQIAYQISNDWTLRGGFSINNQPFHVLVQTYGYYENENWLLANKQYKPQISEQFSCGIFGEIPQTTIQVSMEAYYKTMKNLVFLNPIAYETKSMFDYMFSDGLGRSYGIECLLKKDNGKIQWDIAYVLSKTQRKFNEINNSMWYDSEFDRRHDLNVGFHYFSGKKNIWNLNYILQSGRPFTMPVAYVPKTTFYNGFYVVDGVNNYRMPAYRRFDVSYKRKEIIGQCKTELTLSVINVFARKNPVSVYAKDGKLYSTSLYRVIPSLNLKFYLKYPFQ